MRPDQSDDRSAGQRRADALIDICRRSGISEKAGSRPHLIVRTSVETLAGMPGAPAGELEWGGLIPAETVRRLACDTAISRIVGRGELDAEISRAGRTIPASTRRALDARDLRCRAQTCDRPARWCDAHHLKHWVDGGPTLPNLVLLCRRHHRMVHEDGWHLRRLGDDCWRLVPPTSSVPAHARSA